MVTPNGSLVASCTAGKTVSAALLTRCPPCTAAGNARPADSRRAARAAAMRVAAMRLRAGSGDASASGRRRCGRHGPTAGGGHTAASGRRRCSRERAAAMRLRLACERAAAMRLRAAPVNIYSARPTATKLVTACWAPVRTEPAQRAQHSETQHTAHTTLYKAFCVHGGPGELGVPVHLGAGLVRVRCAQ